MVLWYKPIMSILSIPFGVRQKTIVSFPCDIWFSIKFLMYLEFVFIFCISVQVNYNNQWRTKFYLSPAPFYSFIIGESPISARHWRYMPSSSYKGAGEEQLTIYAFSSHIKVQVKSKWRYTTSPVIRRCRRSAVDQHSYQHLEVSGSIPVQWRLFRRRRNLPTWDLIARRQSQPYGG